MKLEDFIKSKPPELRLGQWFFNQYLGRLKYHDRLHHNTQKLYNNTDDEKSIKFIKGLMEDYQWTELPEMEEV